MKVKKLSTHFLILCVIVLCAPAHAQQWFAKSFDFSTAINQKPDYRTSGTYVTTDDDENATGVLVYGTMGYSENELTGANGGFGKSDGVILFNDLEGNNLWGITLGTPESDYISRVVEDSEGNIAVTGYTVVNGTKKTFIIKLDGTNQGIMWARFYGEGIPTDMINVNDIYSVFESTGYAVSGSRSDGSAFVIYTKLSGSQHWAHKYNANQGSLSLNALIQIKGKDNVVFSGPRYREFLAVAGSNNGKGYVMRLDIATGDILNDLQLSNVIPTCATYALADEYVSIEQRGDAEFVLFGSSGSSKNKIQLTSVSDYNNFTVDWNREIYAGPSTHGFPLDINVTKEGYLGVFEYSGGSQNPLKAVQYDFEGTVVKFSDLANGTGSGINWYASKEKTPISTPDVFPYADFGMECGRAFHFSGTESVCPNPPAGWAQDNIPHARIRLNTESCVEMGFTIANRFCDSYYTAKTGPMSTKSHWISDSDFDLLLGIQYISPNQNTYCESICPQSACVSADVINATQNNVITLSADPGFDTYVWNNGENSENIDILVLGDFSSYSVDQTDANGCVTTKVFNILGHISGKRSLLGEEEKEFLSVSVYPNPTTGLLNIELPKDGLSMEVFDAMGRLLIQEKELSAGELTIDLSSRAKGLYILRFTGNGISKEMKVTKE